MANNPLVRGRAGAPNRWAIPEDVHKVIHQGPGGGACNQAWKDALAGLGRQPTVDDVLPLREQITKQFGIDIYRPGEQREDVAVQRSPRWPVRGRWSARLVDREIA